jgi:hypothetical protein
MASLPSQLNNTGILANEIRKIGMHSPPNTMSTDPGMMQSASPFFRDTMRIDTSMQENAAAKCRTYTGTNGLRQLQKDQATNTAYDPGCGWMFQQGSGSKNPQVNRGVFATHKGIPVMGRSGQPDVIQGSGFVEMDLQRAEQRAADSVANGLANNCANLQLLTSENKPYYGYCKTTGKIIPIDTSGGSVKAMYDNVGNLNYNCKPTDIVPASNAPSGCPEMMITRANREELRPIVEYARGYGPGGRQHPNDHYDPSGRYVGPPRTIEQGFANLQDEYNCQTPFTRDCLIQNVRNAGCTDKGSVLTALYSSKSPSPYDGPLMENAAYKYYVNKTNMPQNLFRDGSATNQETANDILNALANASTDSSLGTGVQSAARDLCLEAGYFSNTYNFCSELNNTDRINAGNITCIQNLWRNGGGDSMGSEYPQIAKWNGSNVGAFIAFRDSIKAAMDSTNKQVQADAINKFIGTQTYGTQISLDLDKNANTRGSEVVWIYTAGTAPVILRCDLMMSSDGEGFPDINEGANQYSDAESASGYGARPAFKYKFGLPSVDDISLTAAFEYRPPANTRIAFKVAVDDGFMIGYNQNPFQGTTTADLDWGSWKGQGVTTYTSEGYNIDTSEGKRNTFIVKYSNGPGYGAFNMSIADYTAGGLGTFKRIAKDASARQHMYLTQEPLAPWLQYEICTRPNGGRGASLGFFEKRWNGPSSPNNKFSFDVISTGVTYQTDTNSILSVPGTKPYISFTSPTSQWYTGGLFAYSAFKTITLMIRPTMEGMIFQHGQDPASAFQGGCTLHLMKQGSYYQFVLMSRLMHYKAPCVLNAWNFVVIQYVDTDGYGIRATTMYAAPYTELNENNSSRAEFLRIIKNQQSSSHPVKTPIMREVGDIVKYSGRLILGRNAWPSSTTAPASCQNLGSASADGRMRVYTRQECEGTLRGIWHASGECTKGTGGSWSWDCKGLNNPSEAVDSRGFSSSSFLGDIAWLHGFRDYIKTDSELYAEMNQTWISRWPNMDGAANTGVPRTKTTIGNNGSVSCDTYCAGIAGKSWNNELPIDWYGAKCIGTTVPGNTCTTVPGMTKGPFCTGNPAGSSPYGCPQNCVCQETGDGWSEDRPAWFNGANAFQSPRLPSGLSDQRSSGPSTPSARTPKQQAPTSIASSVFDLFKW